ncbi:amidohydrolase family protein [Desulfosporosinus sp. BICA1-9]|uniref:amidohydrolase family protein n=1 Tax=Desulfosporosinus sp. BICA1-9 TaxID=1531958 RepID=UPI00054BD781|nr:amidohydrolase family protein [Desulfosporosinus sp. BICA1-9]KJS46158.1 MAG: Enamidase [Peptococcaceae bacterium BRH_c23]KJS90068.1 MAG: Enamidase [Desulfosporosinus sp. BICA1-9]
MATIALINIGTLVTGDIQQSLSKASTIVVQDGIIVKVGQAEILKDFKIEKTIDVVGMTVTPGLIDSHVHPVIGDYTPRQKTQDYLDSAVHGGVTTFISAGEPHFPGRPKDSVGTKALAILVHKSFKNLRSSGLKVHAGAVILEKGLVEADFAEMAKEGVWLVGEVGLGSVKKPEDAIPMVNWAKKYGMKVAMHTGGTSIPGSSTVTADDVIAVQPTVVSHVNGGPTAICAKEVEKLINDTDLMLEIVQCGNPKIAAFTISKLADKDALDRVIFGNDSPSGTGIIPLGILRTISFIASFTNVPAEKVIAMATGNTARVFGLETGLIAEGKEADLVIMDAPMGSIGNNALEALKAGDLPAVALVMVDGVIKVTKSRNTPPSERNYSVK